MYHVTTFASAQPSSSGPSIILCHIEVLVMLSDIFSVFHKAFLVSSQDLIPQKIQPVDPLALIHFLPIE
eukprot:UN16171